MGLEGIGPHYFAAGKLATKLQIKRDFIKDKFFKNKIKGDFKKISQWMDLIQILFK